MVREISFDFVTLLFFFCSFRLEKGYSSSDYETAEVSSLQPAVDFGSNRLGFIILLVFLLPFSSRIPQSNKVVVYLPHFIFVILS